MKTLLSIILSSIFLPFLPQNLTNNFEISGVLENYEGEILYLSTDVRYIYQSEDETPFVDSAEVINNQFKILGNLKESTHAQIWIYNFNDSLYHVLSFILNPNSKVEISGNSQDLDKHKVDIFSRNSNQGWELSNEENKKANSLVDNYLSREAEFWENHETIPDNKERKFFNRKYNKYIKDSEEFFKEDRKIFLQFIKENPNSYESLFLLYKLCLDYFYDEEDLSEIKNLYNEMPKRLKEHSLGKEIYELAFQIEENLSSPIELELLDINNELFNLESLRGQYVLLDFWSSWCGPCRAENPNLKKAYEKYKPFGLEIVSVTWDDERDAWIKAIEKDGMNWIQLFDYDIETNTNPTFDKYGVFSVPTIYLLDKEGYIIAERLRGKKLDKKLSEIFSLN